ncbi:hypothetical protein AMTR_s00071p00145860 [Amborella trichopoda]|uniref:Uncharacterized protein n=1 Tax=Amborella trichopoda TaxID=13333 RepID=U5DBT2_AMBTC|nr:hypothetical protein AMTR_s00071p00145860 [Amborella trichopoda]
MAGNFLPFRKAAHKILVEETPRIPSEEHDLPIVVLSEEEEDDVVIYPPAESFLLSLGELDLNQEEDVGFVPLLNFLSVEDMGEGVVLPPMMLSLGGVLGEHDIRTEEGIADPSVVEMEAGRDAIVHEEVPTKIHEFT